MLTTHRRGERPLSSYKGGQVEAEGSLSPPTLTTATNGSADRSIATQSKKSELRNDSNKPTTNARTIHATDNKMIHLKKIKGKIALLNDNTQIEAATLSVTYWPDRDAHDAYAELILTDSLN